MEAEEVRHIATKSPYVEGEGFPALTLPTVTLRRHKKPTKNGYRYVAIFEGESLGSSVNPEYAVCNELYERGVKGQIRFVHEGKSAGLVVDVEAAVKRGRV